MQSYHLRPATGGVSLRVVDPMAMAARVGVLGVRPDNGYYVGSRSPIRYGATGAYGDFWDFWSKSPDQLRNEAMAKAMQGAAENPDGEVFSMPEPGTPIGTIAYPPSAPALGETPSQIAARQMAEKSGNKTLLMVGGALALGTGLYMIFAPKSRRAYA